MRRKKPTKNTREPAKSPFSLKRILPASLILVSVVITVRFLHGIWLEQCIVTNPAAQIHIQSGEMIRAELLADICKLEKGVNLALLDYGKLRLDALRQLPNLRSVTFRRRLPDKLFVTIEERVPVARMGITGKRTSTGLVTDSEGMVFRKQLRTGSLPIIREAAGTRTLPGKKLGDRAMAAIRLLDALRAPEFAELAPLEADISEIDYIKVFFKSNYAGAKLRWSEMDSDTPSSAANLNRKLTHLRDIMRLGTGAVMWNATDTRVPETIWSESQNSR